MSEKRPQGTPNQRPKSAMSVLSIVRSPATARPEGGRGRGGGLLQKSKMKKEFHASHSSSTVVLPYGAPLCDGVHEGFVLGFAVQLKWE